MEIREMEYPFFQTGGKAKEGIPREAFNQFVDLNFGTQVMSKYPVKVLTEYC